MKNDQPLTQRRWLIASNLAALAILVVFYQLFRDVRSDGLVIAILVGLILLVITTYYFTFQRTRLWKLVHAKDNELDERELQINNIGLKYAYAIFTIIALLVIYWHNIAEIQVN